MTLAKRVEYLTHSPWLAPLAACVVSALALRLPARLQRVLPVDHPKDRSLHDRPIPRGGGLAIWAGFIPVAFFAPFPSPGRGVTLGAWILVAAVSAADDWAPMSPAARLGVQSIAAIFVAGALFGPAGDGTFTAAPWVTIAAAAFVIAGCANLYNFMDGSDGLAAAMAICGFGAYGIASAIAGVPSEIHFALAAASVPFFAINLPPARAFMGDVGSVPLGFLAAAFGLAGIHTGTWPAWFPLLVFLPFIADAVLTIVRRIALRQNLFQAHKSHYYQRLHRMGAGHAGTLLFFGVLIAGTATSALSALATQTDAGWWLLGAWVLAIGFLFAGIDYHWQKFSSARR